jgi:hypothetical protein
MKTSELTGAALDWAVAKCEGLSTYIEVVEGFKPSTDWAQGGPIIEVEGIELRCESICFRWVATVTFPDEVFGGVAFSEGRGSTPLIAAMRCYVASKMGDDVEILDELKENQA